MENRQKIIKKPSKENLEVIIGTLMGITTGIPLSLVDKALHLEPYNSEMLASAAIFTGVTSVSYAIGNYMMGDTKNNSVKKLGVVSAITTGVQFATYALINYI